MTGGPAVKVVLIEDNRADVIRISKMLARDETQDYKVQHRDKLQDGIALCSSEPHDVALLDLTLTDSWGLDTLKSFVAAHPGLPTFVLTGLDDREIGLSAVRAGAQDYLVKDDIDVRGLSRALRYARERHGLDKLRERLRVSERLAAIGRLSGGVAHQINNPATFILANLSLMRQHTGAVTGALNAVYKHLATETDPKRRSALTKALSQAHAREAMTETATMIDESEGGIRRIVAVVKELSAFADIDVERVELVDINQAVEMAVGLARAQFPSGVAVQTSLEDLPYLSADRSKITQAVLNLLQNAIEACDELRGRAVYIEGERDLGQVVQVSTIARPTGIQVLVRDNGVGVPVALRDKLFQPFVSGKSQDRTGLGLPLAADVARWHGGELEYQPLDGGHERGSLFTITLPFDTGLALPDADEQPVVAVADDQPRGRKRVLFVDDEVTILVAYRRALGRRFDVEIADGGEKAIAMLDQGRVFDAIVCDIMMPGVDGEALYDEIMRRDTELAQRIVFCTGGTFTSRSSTFAARIPNLIFEKPVDLGLLERAISQIAAK